MRLAGCSVTYLELCQDVFGIIVGSRFCTAFSRKHYLAWRFFFFHFLMKYMNLLKIQSTLKTVMGERKSDDESIPGLAKKCRFAAPLTDKQIAAVFMGC